MMTNLKHMHKPMLMQNSQLKTAMYVIFHEPTKRYFIYNPLIRQFRLTEAKNHYFTSRHLLHKDLMFNKMTDQTNYVRQNRMNSS